MFDSYGSQLFAVGDSQRHFQDRLGSLFSKYIPSPLSAGRLT